MASILGSSLADPTAMIRRGLNFTLTTAHGDLDLLGEIVGGGTYEQLAAHTIKLEIFGTKSSSSTWWS